LLEFILERYNYWIVIALMMMGLYIVYARGNLVKKIVGLNLFQTSVFIFYITIGKIAGGTAPIYIGGELDYDGEGGGKGGGEGLHGAPEGDKAANVMEPGASALGDESLHAKIENKFPEMAGNDLKTALRDLEPSGGTEIEGLHETAEGAGKIANKIFDKADKAAGFEIAAPETGDASDLHAAPGAVDGAVQSIADAASNGAILYTNPLPHVLILTAIVVGVATTAVGLALAIRIREAYGTIEEDELEAIDNIAEFGAGAAGAAGAAPGGSA